MTIYQIIYLLFLSVIGEIKYHEQIIESNKP
jgi:hypothetical protein